MNRIDPTQSLAFSMQASPGVYALLLGSGISRGAGIPTGWEIVLDLLRKLAAVSGQSATTDPEEWYRDTYGNAPDYSEILESLATTQTERQQLLRPYFEPSEEDRDEGLKQPTAAHRAIAQLVARGYIKVIVSVNFDRLLEKALEEAGVTPTVLSTPDQVAGAPPLIHTDCCVLKVHGDYMDTRIRNSPAELGKYPPEFNQLLDRIVDDFGLVVCGWSATWDDALRQAIERAPHRRYTTYWAHYGPLTDEATHLVNHRDAQLILIPGADPFFQSLQQTVESLEDYARPHPLSTAAAVATLKRYLLRPEDSIRLEDHIRDTAERVVSDSQALQRKPLNTSEWRDLEEYLGAYESAAATMLEMSIVGGYWANEQNLRGWEHALQRLCPREPSSNPSAQGYLEGYPATLLLYALSLGILRAGNLQLLNRVFTAPVNANATDAVFRQTLPLLFSPSSAVGIQEFARRARVPESDTYLASRARAVLRLSSRQSIPSDEEYTRVFDMLDAIVGMAFLNYSGMVYDWAPMGDVTYRWPEWVNVLREIRGSIARLGETSPYVKSGIIGIGPQECLQIVNRLSTLAWEVARSRNIWWVGTIGSSPP